MSDLRRDHRRHAAPAAARSRATWPPRASASSCSSAATGCRASRRTGSRRTCSSTTATSRRTRGTTSTASRSSRRSTTSSAARRSSTARRSTGCARRTSASCATTTASRRPGRSPTTRSSRTTRRPSSSTRCTARAARTRPSRRRARPYPFPAVSHEPRIQQLSDDLAAAGLPPVPRAVRDHARTRRTCRTAPACAARTATASPAWCTRKSDAEVLGVRPALEHPNVTLLTNARGGHARDERRRAPRSPRSSSSATARPRDVRARTSSSSPAARRTRRSCCSSSANDKHPNGLANGSDQVGRNYMFHNSQAVLALSQRGEPDGLPEDARAERLLLRQRRLRVPARQHPDGRQVAGADVPRREAGARRSSRRMDARADRPPRGRLLALDRGPAAAREPRHASTATASSR